MSVATRPPTSVIIYTTANTGALTARLQQQAAASSFALTFTPLTAHSEHRASMAPILVACQNAVDAAQCVRSHALQQQPVYWLLMHPVDADIPALGKGHRVVHWQHGDTLLALLETRQAALNMHTEARASAAKEALLASTVGELSLVLHANATVKSVNPALSDMLGVTPAQVVGRPWQECLEVASPSAIARINTALKHTCHSRSMTRLASFPVRHQQTISVLDGLTGTLEGGDSLLILRQVATLPAAGFSQTSLQHSAPLSLLLINPDNLSDINSQFGRDVGDAVMTQILARLTAALRHDDVASRYSGAVFSAYLPATPQAQGETLASRIIQLLSSEPYTPSGIRVSFSVGLASLPPEDNLDAESPLELFRRANSALQAARSVGGGRLVIWQPHHDVSLLANLDRMSGKYSHTCDDDFRLMALQWEIIRLLGNATDLATLGDQLCQAVHQGLPCYYAALYVQQPTTLQRIAESGSHSQLPAVVTHWLQQALTASATNTEVTSVAEAYNLSGACIRLDTRQRRQGVLVICWQNTADSLAQRNLSQLNQVSANLAAALDRLNLLATATQRTHAVPAADKHELIYASASMRTLLQQVQLVAPTDASVLLVGESGTGKEVIAQQLHRHSPVATRPFVTVDCSTLVGPLMESELFGHRKGAFTGAVSDQPGKIVQADGGTLFLDEIGELPLDIQAKLLRFVQEKTFIPVGDQRVRRVNVRLILATNRDLEQEVALGRFRADLWYRINVFTLTLPPLREREGDPITLARHFLAIFSEQYAKPIVGISEQAAQRLVQHTWPGNVRELRNCMMRAVILCDGPHLQADHLPLPGEPDRATVAQDAPPVAATATPTEQPALAELFAGLTEQLTAAVDSAQHHSPTVSASAWLEQIWLQQCLEKWGSLYQVAQHLQQSESTLRRHHAKLMEQTIHCPALTRLTPRCRDLLSRMLQTDNPALLWPRIAAILNQIVLAQQATQQTKARLLNVTQPTLRKLIRQQ